jgi:hypothetical protein
LRVVFAIKNMPTMKPFDSKTMNPLI